jgi:hypothetical protein
MKPSELCKPKRQKKIAFRGISKSQKTKLFAEIAVMTLLIGIFLFPSTYASSTASITLQGSGTIVASSTNYGIFNSGWEKSGGTDVTDGGKWDYGAMGSPIVQSSIVNTGNYSLKCFNSGDYVTENLPSGYSDLLVSFYVYFPSSLPIYDNIDLLFVYDSSWGNSLTVVVQPYSTSAFWHVGSLSYQGPPISMGQWYNVTVERTVGAGNGVINLWINGVNVISNNAQTIASNAQNIQLGECSSSTGVTLYFDDVAVSTSQAPTITPTISPVTIDTSMTLHTVGMSIYDANGHQVYLRGIGLPGDITSLDGQWFGISAPLAYGNKFVTDQPALTANINAELSLFKNTWDVNSIRIIFPADWWYYDNLTAIWNGTNYVIQPYPNTTGNPVFSFRNYVELVAQLAMAQGIYVDFCPFQILNYYNDTNSNGIPMVSASQDLAQQAWLASVDSGNETNFWINWWHSVDQRLGKYPNVIFEMWNEPCLSTVIQPDPYRFNYYNEYLYPCYNQIRNVDHETNLIMMQYYTGISPGFRDLSYCGEIYSTLSNLTVSNLVFTTHLYRDIPGYGLNTGWGIDQTTINSQMAAMMATYTPPCPFVCNENGVATDTTMYNNSAYSNMANETWSNALSFWNAILTWCGTNNVGFTAYFWMCQDGTYGVRNEALLQAGGVSPNDVGAAFIAQTSPP